FRFDPATGKMDLESILGTSAWPGPGTPPPARASDHSTPSGALHAAAAAEDPFPFLLRPICVNGVPGAEQQLVGGAPCPSLTPPNPATATPEELAAYAVAA